MKKFVPIILLMFYPAYSCATEYTAALGWAEKNIISFEVEGTVNKVYVQEGQFVEKGVRLIAIDNTHLLTELRAINARVKGLKPVLADAKREKVQAESLYEQTVLSQVELEKAQLVYHAALAELGEANQHKIQAKNKLDNTVQMAPWDAWVFKRMVQPGQVIVGDARAQPLLILVRANKMLAQVNIPSSVVSKLHVGKKLNVLFNGETISGEISRLSMESVNDLFEVSVAFDFKQKQPMLGSQEVVIQIP